jgi:hypothetical protein
MHNHIKAPIAALCAAIAACLLATTVEADPALAPASSAAGTSEADKPGMTTGSVNVEDKAKKQLADCMAIWEPRTHMTKEQWRRTCKRSLGELPHI